MLKFIKEYFRFIGFTLIFVVCILEFYNVIPVNALASSLFCLCVVLIDMLIRKE